MSVRDPELRLLLAISADLEQAYQNDETIWADSPFAWIKRRPSRQVGAIGEKLVSGWLAARGFNVSRSNDSDADRVIEGKRVEIKMSTLWANGGYRFQQIRDQNYELAIFLGLSPSEAHCWIIPKLDLIRLWKIDQVITSQHGGQEGTDTAWVGVDPMNQPHWLMQYGGKLSDAISVLSDITGYKVPKL